MGFPEGTYWQYKCPFRRAWADCTNDEDLQLKNAYMKCEKEPEVTYLLNGVRFKANFVSMERMNVASKRKMELRLQGGSLPFPSPQPGPGQSAPSEASKGKSDGTPEGVTQILSPEALNFGPGGRPVPHGIRKAWGQGVSPGTTMAGEFEFTMNLEDKDYFGEMITWQMLSTGITPETLNNSILEFTDKKGQKAVGNRDAIQAMLDNSDSYPVRVKYDPPPMTRGMTMDKLPGTEMNRVFLKHILVALNNVDHDIHKVKHTHQRRTFERYQMYLQDHYYQNSDDLSSAMNNWEFYMKFPFLTGCFGLIDKSGPNLTRILTGEADVLEFLFGG